ncbi:hypothetical protein CEXT_421661 [Caerostris extrusa]|uniref:Uncharacterized protein n=1 Tax=Caerostris extrusa TaxID=172846 RepID=A0AAV4WYK8_CAEEX|nr:hypothetical protein CEXT_421661 [Caerostris extrusa]
MICDTNTFDFVETSHVATRVVPLTKEKQHQQRESVILHCNRRETSSAEGRERISSFLLTKEHQQQREKRPAVIRHCKPWGETSSAEGRERIRSFLVSLLNGRAALSRRGKSVSLLLESGMPGSTYAIPKCIRVTLTANVNGKGNSEVIG